MFLLFVRYLHGGHDGRRMPSELGILSFELRIMRQGALWVVHFELVGRIQPIQNSVQCTAKFLFIAWNYKWAQCKPRRLWRPALATHPRTQANEVIADWALCYGSHAPTNDQQIEYELRVPRSGTYIMKPTASCEAAQLWVRAILPPHIVPRRVGCSKSL